MKNKDKILLIGSCVILSACVGVGAALAVIKLSAKNSTNIPETVTTVTELEQAEVVNEDTGEVKTYITGGTATLSTSSGETINLKIADDMYNISNDYLSILAQGFGVSKAVTAPNTVITGNMPSVTQSMTSINAAPFSDIIGIYKQIFGEEYVGEDTSIIWSPAYTMLKTGEFPETLPDNYSCEEVTTFESNGITWTCFNVSFSTDYTNYYDSDGNPIPEEDIVRNVIDTQHLACYSDTEDPIEILVYEENNNVDTELSMVKEFLKME